MFYPHADDENVAMGYAIYHKEENDTMVTIDPKAFRTYIFANYISQFDKDTLLDVLESNIETSVLVDMAQHLWQLPFDIDENDSISLVDANELLFKHSEIELPNEDCLDCPDYDNDYDIITDDGDRDDEEFAPFDELDENIEEQ